MRSVSKPGGGIPRAVVLSKLSNVGEDAAAIKRALIAEGSSPRVDADRLQSLLDTHRASLGTDSVKAMEQLVRHAAQSGKSVFDLAGSDGVVQVRVPEAPASRIAKLPVHRSFTGATAPRIVSGVKDGIETTAWARGFGPHARQTSGTPIVVPGSDDVFVWNTRASGPGVQLQGYSRSTGDFTGEWAFAQGTSIGAPVANARGDTLYVFEGDDTTTALHVLDLVSGEVRSTFALKTDTLPTNQSRVGAATLSPDEKTVYVVGQDTRLHAFSADGSGRKWEAPELIRCKGAPVASPDGGSLVVDCMGSLRGLNAETGAQSWRWPVPESRSPTRMEFTPDGKQLIVSHAKGLAALDAATGEKLWDRELFLSHNQAFAMSTTGDFVAVTDNRGRLNVIACADGDERASIPLEHEGKTLMTSWGLTPALMNGDSEALVKTAEGEFVRVDLKSEHLAVGPRTFDIQNEFAVTPDGSHAIVQGRQSVYSIPVPEFG